MFVFLFVVLVLVLSLSFEMTRGFLFEVNVVSSSLTMVRDDARVLVRDDETPTTPLLS